MTGSKELSFINYMPQGDSWCEFASALLCVSIYMREQMGIDKVFNPVKLWKYGEPEDAINKSFKYWFDEKKLAMSLGNVNFYTEYQKRVHYGWIQRAIDSGFPVQFACSNWKEEDLTIVPDFSSNKVGHFFVIVGYSDNYFILDNPWGIAYARRKIHKRDLKLIGGGLTVFKKTEDKISLL